MAVGRGFGWLHCRSTAFVAHAWLHTAVPDRRAAAVARAYASMAALMTS
jgi:hypothetical protein